jgi:carbon storage regulator CsrA
MLVVMRHTGEEIVITLEDGREITVVLLGLDRGRARLGIDAARSIEVDRREIWARKHPDRVNGNVAEPEEEVHAS